MLLVCGGKGMIEQTMAGNHDTHTLYPPVIAVVSENDLHKLPAILETVVEPFIIRLSDKDLAKIIASKAGQEALKT